MERANDAHPPSRKPGTEFDEQQIGALIVALEQMLREPPPTPTGFPQGRAAQARERIRLRRMRSEHLPASLFGEPAWDMLLDLYAATYEGKAVCVSSLCLAAAVPSTTALRAVENLVAAGYIVRRRDPADGRRIFLELTDAARCGLDAYFDAANDARN